MTTEQQIEESIINLITSSKSTIRCVKNDINYTLIVSRGKKELHVDSHWLVDDERMLVRIYGTDHMGSPNTLLHSTYIYSGEAACVLRAVRDKKVAEDAEKRAAQEEKERHDILSFLDSND